MSRSRLLNQLNLDPGSLIIDPFAGSAVTGTSARRMGYSFFGIEAHPAIAELGALKLQEPPASAEGLLAAGKRIADLAPDAPVYGGHLAGEPDLVQRSFSADVLKTLSSNLEDRSEQPTPNHGRST